MKKDVWYSDGTSVFLLEETGRVLLADGSYKAELRNRFYFSVQIQGSATRADAEVIAKRIATLLNNYED